jgi:UDP-glucose 4-epimerase
MSDPISSIRRRFMVTGSSGQLGARTVDALVELGYPVIALDRRQPSSQSRSRSSLVEYVTRNLTDLDDAPEGLQESAAQITDLVHLAARVADIPSTSPDAPCDLKAEIYGAVNLLRLIPNVSSIVYSSSEMVYGNSNGGLHTEDSDASPTNLYGVLKATLEDYFLQYGKSNHCRVAILRLASVYGSTLDGSQALPIFIKTVLAGQPPVISGPPDVRRDRVHIDDVIDAITAAVESKKSGIFNIGSGSACSTIELARMVISGVESNVEPVIQQRSSNMAELVSRDMDISKAWSELGYAPKFDIRTGVNAVIRKFS